MECGAKNEAGWNWGNCENGKKSIQSLTYELLVQNPVENKGQKYVQYVVPELWWVIDLGHFQGLVDLWVMGIYGDLSCMVYLY